MQKKFDPFIYLDAHAGDMVTVLSQSGEEPFFMFTSNGEQTDKHQVRLAPGDVVRMRDMPVELKEQYSLSEDQPPDGSVEAIYHTVLCKLGRLTEQGLCIDGQPKPIPLQEFANQGVILEVIEESE